MHTIYLGYLGSQHAYCRCYSSLREGGGGGNAPQAQYPPILE